MAQRKSMAATAGPETHVRQLGRPTAMQPAELQQCMIRPTTSHFRAEMYM